MYNRLYVNRPAIASNVSVTTIISIFFIVLVVYENVIRERTQLYRRIEEAFCDKKSEIIVSATYRFALKRLGVGEWTDD